MKITKIVTNLCVLLFFTNNPLLAQQWNFYKDLPLTTIPEQISVSNNGNLYVYANGIHIRKNNAASWERMGGGAGGPINNPSIILRNDPISDAIFFSASSIKKISSYYDFNNYLSSTTSFNGFTSQSGVTTYSQPSEILVDGNRVLCITPPYGGGTSIFISNSGGNSGSWIGPVINDSNHTVTTGDVLSANNYVLATNTGLVVYSSNGGLNWSSAGFNTSFTYKQLKAGFGKLFALTYQDVNNSSTYTIKISSNNGTTWSDVDLTGVPTQIINKLAFDATNNKLYLCGKNGLYSKSSETSDWVNESGDITNTEFTSVAFYQNNVYATTGIGTYGLNVYKKTNSTSTWTSFSEGLTNPFYTETVEFDSNNKINIGNAFKSVTKENGTNWENTYVADETNVSPYHTEKLFSDEAGNLYYFSGANLFYSQSSGAYVNLNCPQINNISIYLSPKVYAKGDNIYVSMNNMSGYSTVYHYNHTQQVWNLIYDHTASKTLKNIFFINNDAYFYETSASGTTHHYRKTSNNGNSFENYLSDTNSGFIPVTTANNVIYGIQQNQIKYYNPDTASLASNAFPVGETFAQTYSLVSKNDKLYFIGTNNIYLTTNMGLNWQTIPKPLNLSPNNYSYFTDNNGVLFCSRLNTTNPNDRGIYYFDQSLSIDDIQSIGLQVSVYPNPTKDILNISGVSNLKSVSVFNMLGQQVLTESVSSTNTHQLNISKLLQGTYLVKVEGEQASQTIKVIKE